MVDERYWFTVIIVLIPMTLAASWIDYRQHRVPNWLNLMLGLMGLAFQYTYFGWPGLRAGFLGLGTGILLLILPWAMHLMGTGDVKLLAAIGAWLGPGLVLQAFVFGALIGGVIGMVMILAAGRVTPALGNLFALMIKCRSRQLLFSEMGSVKAMGAQAQLLPYGVPLTLGAWVALGLKLGGW